MTHFTDIEQLPLLLRAVLALAGGALSVFAFAPFGFAWLAVVGPLLLIIVLQGVSPRAAFNLGWLWGVGLLGPGVFWLRVSIEQFGGVNLPLALVITLGFALLVALFYGLACWVAVRAGPNGESAFLLLFPTAWVLGEWLRGWVLTGFPWLSMGYSQIDTPLGGYAPVLGVYGVSLAVVASAVAIRAWRKGWPLLLLSILWVGGWGLKQIAWTDTLGAPFEVSIIQGNVAQEQKWQPAQFAPTLQRYLNMTEQVSGSRLVVWPETAVPAYAHQVETALLQPLADSAIALGQDVVVGIPVLEPDERYYNAMMNLGISGRDLYYKRHLVPFGEFMPFSTLTRPLIELLAIPMSQFSAGQAERPLLTTVGYAAAVSVCYEDAFGAETIEALPEAAFLVNVSNDAWFGDSLAPWQHLEIARMRALETGRYMVRATNTGVSAIIGPGGELQDTAPQFQQAVLTASIEPRQGATPYVRVGNYGIVLLCLLLAILAYQRRRI